MTTLNPAAAPAPAVHPALPAVRHAWTGLRTLRSTWLLLGLAPALQIGHALLDDRHGTGPTAQFGTGLSLVTLLSVVLVSAVGVNAFGAEYRHGTISATVLALRSRTWTVVGKALVVAALGAATAAVCAGVDLLGTATLGGGAPDLGRAAPAAAGTVLYVMLSGLIGLALAGLTRSAVAALALVVLWPTVLETLLVAVLHLPSRALPFMAAKQLADVGGTASAAQALPLAALAALLLAGNAVALSRRGT